MKDKATTQTNRDMIPKIIMSMKKRMDDLARYSSNRKVELSIMQGKIDMADAITNRLAADPDADYVQDPNVNFGFSVSDGARNIDALPVFVRELSKRRKDRAEYEAQSKEEVQAFKTIIDSLLKSAYECSENPDQAVMPEIMRLTISED